MAEAENGHPGAHTPAPAELDDDADALDLDGSPDLLTDDVLGAATELVASQRRARGRPKGSANKRNGDMLRYLQSLGHRDPMVTMSMIQTADTKTLARVLTADPIDVLRVQAACARDMLPYLYAKKPQQLELPPGDARPVMVIGEMNVQQVTNVAMMSAGEAPEQYQALSEALPVRDRKPSSHDED